MTVSRMRTAIAGAYPGEGWRLRVSDMPEHQVIAVYYKFLNDGKFDKKKKKSDSSDNKEYVGVQLKLNITY